jgi:signal transduction histidine kinase
LEIVQSVGQEIGRVVKRRRVQEALKLSKEAADAANQAKSEFLANMSREIRIPMNAVIGMSELLRDADMRTTQRDYARMIHESVPVLLEIINDILDFSTIEAGKLELDPRPFSLQESVADTMKSLALQSHHKQLGIRLYDFRRYSDRTDWRCETIATGAAQPCGQPSSLRKPAKFRWTFAICRKHRTTPCWNSQ